MSITLFNKMLGYIDIDEMVVEIKVPLHEKDVASNTKCSYIGGELDIVKIYDILGNTIYDKHTKNDELYTSFLLNCIITKLTKNKFYRYYTNKTIVIDKCIYYIFFINKIEELRQKYPISSMIRLYNSSGIIINEFYHNSGKIEGSYKVYDYYGCIINETNYVNGNSV